MRLSIIQIVQCLVWDGGTYGSACFSSWCDNGIANHKQEKKILPCPMIAEQQAETSQKEISVFAGVHR
jgi:hypothetical protein